MTPKPKRQQIHVRYDNRRRCWKVTGRDASGPWTRFFEFENTLRRAREYAIEEANRITKAGGTVELYVHRKSDQTIADRRTYPRSSDPRRSRG